MLFCFFELGLTQLCSVVLQKYITNPAGGFLKSVKFVKSFFLARPNWVSETDFEKELKFYQLCQPKDIAKKEYKLKEDAMRQRKREAAARRPRYQKIIWNLMEYPRSSTPAFTCAIISIITIILSVVVICLETVPFIIDDPNPKMRSINRQVLFILETTVMVWFTAEYLLRILSAPLTFRFLFSFTGIIDLVVVLPYYINIVIGEEIRSFNLAIFRLVRMFRVFRIFKLTRYSTGLKVLGRTIMESLGQLVALFLCLFLSAILFASCLYFIEHHEVLNDVHDASSRRPSDVFQSIPGTFWYVIITMTSVGYGDVVPRTLIGRIVAAFCMVTGIIVLLCLPTPVFVTHFGRFYDDVIREEKDKENENNGVFNEEEIDQNSEDSLNADIWRNHNELIVPAWANDSAWKDKLRNDLQQQQNLATLNPPTPCMLTTSVSGLNAYLSSSNLFLSSRTCSPDFLHTPQHTPS